jgi:hypothetical protein
MHKNEFLHCSSSYSHCTNQTCTLRQRRWTSSCCTAAYLRQMSKLSVAKNLQIERSRTAVVHAGLIGAKAGGAERTGGQRRSHRCTAYSSWAPRAATNREEQRPLPLTNSTRASTRAVSIIFRFLCKQDTKCSII